MTVTTDDGLLSAFADEIGAVDPIAVRGGGTRWTLGGTLDPGTRVVSAPSGIVDHRPEEMIVRVRAGTPVEVLHETLRIAGQRTALPERGGTVGGAVVVGENHLDVLRRGRVRDAVLQVRYVDSAGAMVTAGGAVVKNVTGFNLPKLLVGSLGTFGLVAEVVLRTNPIPPADVWLVAEGIDPRAALEGTWRPAAVLWDGMRTWVHLEGHRADVESERAGLDALGGFVEAEGPPPLGPHRWSLRPQDVLALDGVATGAFVASVGVGTVWAERPQPTRRLEGAAATVATRLKALFDPDSRLNPGRVP